MKWILSVLIILNVVFAGIQIFMSTLPDAEETEVQSSRFNNLGVTNDQRLRLEAAATPAQNSAAEQTEIQCIRVVGLTEDEGVPIVESRLSALDINPERAVQRELIRMDYQVIRGPFESESLARSGLQEVIAKGVESYVIAEGEFQNSLSLGVFSNQENAARRLSELSSLEIVDARVVEKPTYRTQTNLIISAESAALLTDATLQSVLGTFPDSEFIRYSCS